MHNPPLTLETHAAFEHPPALFDRARRLVERQDEVSPAVSDQTWVDFSASVVGTLTSPTGSDLAGLAVRTPDNVVELVVDAGQRGRGLGRQLAEWVLDQAREAGDPLRVWAHGSHPGAVALARSLGYVPARSLHVMERSLDPETGLPAPGAAPRGWSVDPFRPGVDEEEWLRANAAAFQSHPEQGSWTMDDLLARMAEEWFDPASLLMIRSEGRTGGFVWSKRERGSTVGEIYVVGVVPEAQGSGLGKYLTLAGMERLRTGGARNARLYVDEENTAAFSLYRALGFRSVVVDMMYVKG